MPSRLPLPVHAAGMIAAVVLAVVSAVGCADGGDAAGKTTTTRAVAVEPEPTVPVTEPQSAPEPAPTTTTETPVATTIPIGLPSSLNVLPAGAITVGAGSSMSSTIVVRGVPVADVVGWAVPQLQAAGWTVDAVPAPESAGPVDVQFHGPGAAGLLRVEPTEPPDHVRVVLAFGPR